MNRLKIKLKQGKKRIFFDNYGYLSGYGFCLIAAVFIPDAGPFTGLLHSLLPILLPVYAIAVIYKTINWRLEETKFNCSYCDK